MGTTRPVILVVDDDPSIAELIRTMLGRAGFDAMIAGNAKEAETGLRSQPMPHMMILDLMLPDISGLDFLKQVRAQSQYDELPVLILSALVDPDEIRAGLAAGADRYVTKPYLANNLIPTVNDLMRMGRVRK